MPAKKLATKGRRPNKAAASEVSTKKATVFSLNVDDKTPANTALGQLVVQHQFQQKLVDELNVLLGKLAMHLPGGIDNVVNIAKAMVAEAEEDEAARAPKTLVQATAELPRMAVQQDDWPVQAAAHNDNNENLRKSMAVVMALNSVL